LIPLTSLHYFFRTTQMKDVAVAADFWSTHFSLASSLSAKEKFSELFGFSLTKPCATRWWSFYEEINKTLPKFMQFDVFLDGLIAEEICKAKATRLKVCPLRDVLYRSCPLAHELSPTT
jgi:hypothetical protein